MSEYDVMRIHNGVFKSFSMFLCYVVEFRLFQKITVKMVPAYDWNAFWNKR